MTTHEQMYRNSLINSATSLSNHVCISVLLENMFIYCKNKAVFKFVHIIIVTCRSIFLICWCIFLLLQRNWHILPALSNMVRNGHGSSDQHLRGPEPRVFSYGLKILVYQTHVNICCWCKLITFNWWLTLT